MKVTIHASAKAFLEAGATGWKIARFFDSKGSIYIAVLEKEQ